MQNDHWVLFMPFELGDRKLKRYCKWYNGLKRGVKMKVSLEPCTDYTYKKLRHAMEASLERLGGLENYIEPGSRVLLKANLLMKKKPEEATTTHPMFIRVLGDILVDAGMEVIVGDSPGGPFNENVLKQLYAYCQYDTALKSSSIQLNMNTTEMELSSERAKILKKIKVLGVLKDVDHVISVAKFKTHQMTKFTGAVKNMFGIVPGVQKVEYHFRMPEIYDFSDALVDICLYGNPTLSFMDAVVGMQGDGPSAGEPRRIGCVIASESPFHLDVVASYIAGIEPHEVPTTMRAVERGLCVGDLTDVEVVGDAIASFKMNDFKVPNIRSVKMLDRLPIFLQGPMSYYLKSRPVFSAELCIGCGECARACPPKAIDMINKKPAVRLDACIRCFCCQELCPAKAVKVHRSWLLKQLLKW